jgi:uncharacterized protein YbjT (DUF2867 family)
MKTILITGAAGNIGGQLRRQLAGKYKLRVSDKQPLAPSEGETFVQADIADMAAALAISKAIDAIVHLGGYAGEGPFGGRSCRLTSSVATSERLRLFRYAQPRGLALKVSDEFTVPLCAIHHGENHAIGDERRWWLERKIDPLTVAAEL